MVSGDNDDPSDITIPSVILDYDDADAIRAVAAHPTTTATLTLRLPFTKDVTLSPGVPQSGSLPPLGMSLYRLTVSRAARVAISVTTTTAAGDIDLYVSTSGRPPTVSEHQFAGAFIYICIHIYIYIYIYMYIVYIYTTVHALSATTTTAAGDIDLYVSTSGRPPTVSEHQYAGDLHIYLYLYIYQCTCNLCHHRIFATTAAGDIDLYVSTTGRPPTVSEHQFSGDLYIYIYIYTTVHAIFATTAAGDIDQRETAHRKRAPVCR